MREQATRRSRWRRTSGQVVEAERLATLGTFAASVCHELNNIVTVMAATLELLERDPASLDASKLGSLNHVSSHIQALSRAVLKIARPQRSPATVTTDLREVVRDVEEMTRVTGRTRHLVLEVVAPDRPMPVLVTSVHAQQVLLNLVVNAADALAGRDDPRLRIELIAGASHVACVVKDNGCGMTPDVLARVFEPFFTTKPPGAGTGLGMPVVQHLVDAWGGALAIQTTPGRGHDGAGDDSPRLLTTAGLLTARPRPTKRSGSSVRTTRAGFPATTVKGATSSWTTAPAPRTAPRPTVTPGRMITPEAIHTSSPMVTGRPGGRRRRSLRSWYALSRMRTPGPMSAAPPDGDALGAAEPHAVVDPRLVADGQRGARQHGKEDGRHPATRLTSSPSTRVPEGRWMTGGIPVRRTPTPTEVAARRW